MKTARSFLLVSSMLFAATAHASGETDCDILASNTTRPCVGDENRGVGSGFEVFVFNTTAPSTGFFEVTGSVALYPIEGASQPMNVSGIETFMEYKVGAVTRTVSLMRNNNTVMVVQGSSSGFSPSPQAINPIYVSNSYWNLPISFKWQRRMGLTGSDVSIVVGGQQVFLAGSSDTLPPQVRLGRINGPTSNPNDMYFGITKPQ